MTTASVRLADVAASWYDAFRQAGGTVGIGPDAVIAQARRDAAQFLVSTASKFDARSGVYALTPGNSTLYTIVATDVSVDGQGTASAVLGGPLLISLPENGGRCAVFGGGLHTPEWVMERLGVRWPDAVPLATYISAFTQALDLD